MGCRGGCFGCFFRLLSGVAGLFILAFIGMFALQLYLEKTLPPPGEYAAMIVLGAQVNPDRTPSVQLEWRLSKALDMYSLKRVPIVVTGAQGKDEPQTEASAMRDWLINRGVAPADILMDEDSFNTRENLAHAIVLLPPGTRDVLIVTSDYHMPRALRVAKDLALNASGAPSPIKPEFWWKNHLREALAWGKYFAGKVVPLPFLQ